MLDPLTKAIPQMTALTERGSSLWRWVTSTPHDDPPPVPGFEEGTFTATSHDEAPAAWLGVALGVTFGLCFLTGVVSHLVQHDGSVTGFSFDNVGGWALWGPRPAGLYRLNQGLHVISGTLAVPLLLVKLYVVYPLLFQWPPLMGVRNLIDRLTIPVLIAGAFFLLVSGVQNVAYWYPWGFSFPVTHYWSAWITIGALVMHIGAKSHIVARVWRGRRPKGAVLADADEGGLSRRGVLALAGTASGVLFLTTAGATIAPLERLALLSSRRPSVGPQGFPINTPASVVGVTEAATDPGYRLRITGNVAQELELSADDLAALAQTEAVLPISCVEGWSASVRWGGVAIRDVLAAAGVEGTPGVTIVSLQESGPYRMSTLNPAQAADPESLLATSVDGEPLHIDHGFPVRLMVPNNPGVTQTKWVAEVQVL